MSVGADESKRTKAVNPNKGKEGAMSPEEKTILRAYLNAAWTDEARSEWEAYVRKTHKRLAELRGPEAAARYAKRHGLCEKEEG